jgi:hypothetical protein
MRDRTKETAEAIDQTRMDMAMIEGTLTFAIDSKIEMAQLKQIMVKQRDALKALRQGLNKARFDNTFSPLGFDLQDE